VTTSPPAERVFAPGHHRKLAVRLDGVSKAYKMYARPFDLLKEALTGRPHHREKRVLTDISLAIPQGEIVGIIGRNGAGKSTLLKIIAGTLAASQGTIDIEGRVSAILELGTGFNINYSGRDNVVLSALMRGMSEAEIRRKFDGIVAFSGLEDVIDQPVNTYSSGMQARLAFAAAVAVEADVLIIDEALAAGDAQFAARSFQRIREICQSGVTALFVSHQTYQVMQLCGRAIWIDEGRVRMDGAPIDVVRAYEYDMHERIARDQGRMATPAPPAGIANAPPASAESPPQLPAAMSALPPADEAGSRHASQAGSATPAAATTESGLFSTGRYRIIDISFTNKEGERSRIFRFGETLRLRVSYECLLPELPGFSCGVAVAFNRVADFEAVMYFNTNYPHSDDELRSYPDASFRKYIGRRGLIEAVIDPLQLRAGEYYVSIGLLPNQPGAHEFHEYRHCHLVVKVVANGFDEPSVFYPMVTWTNGPLNDS
jgi:ABC-type polysaccharide/polyol phosphate transport system ATPase subunit